LQLARLGKLAIWPMVVLEAVPLAIGNKFPGNSWHPMLHMGLRERERALAQGWEGPFGMVGVWKQDKMRLAPNRVGIPWGSRNPGEK
jgi:hypothetical protein